MSAAPEAELITQLAIQLGIEPILSSQDIPSEINQNVVFQDFMERQNGTICILKDGSVLTNTLTSAAVHTAVTLCNYQGLTPTIRPAILRVITALIEGGEELPQPVSKANRSEVQHMLNDLLSMALFKSATDIHIEIREDKPARVRLRIDGLLRDHDTISYVSAIELGSVLFTSESNRGSEFSMTAPLQGSLKPFIDNRLVPIRLATIPECRGVDILMRLDVMGSSGKDMKSLGLDTTVINDLMEASRSPHGLLIFSGPVGAGKSTLMRALVRTLPTNLKVTFLEDPVEDALETATHVELDETSSASTMDVMQRSITRWDGDVNVLGEIRDPTSIKAAQTLVLLGRRVLATLHAVRVLSIPTRLAHLGLDRTLLCEPGFLRALVNQRLLPLLCEHCSEPVSEDNWSKSGEHSSSIKMAKTGGCERCDETGFKGRLLICEYLTVTDEDRVFIASGDTLGWKNDLRKRGWIGIEKPAWEAVLSGRADPEIVDQLVGLPEKQDR